LFKFLQFIQFNPKILITIIYKFEKKIFFLEPEYTNKRFKKLFLISTIYHSVFQPFSSCGTSRKFLIIWWNLNAPYSTIYSIFREPSKELAEPLGSAEPRLKNTDLSSYCYCLTKSVLASKNIVSLVHALIFSQTPFFAIFYSSVFQPFQSCGNSICQNLNVDNIITIYSRNPRYSIFKEPIKDLAKLGSAEHRLKNTA